MHVEPFSDDVDLRSAITGMVWIDEYAGTGTRVFTADIARTMAAPGNPDGLNECNSQLMLSDATAVMNTVGALFANHFLPPSLVFYSWEFVNWQSQPTLIHGIFTRMMCDPSRNIALCDGMFNDANQNANAFQSWLPTVRTLCRRLTCGWSVMMNNIGIAPTDRSFTEVSDPFQLNRAEYPRIVDGLITYSPIERAPVPSEAFADLIARFCAAFPTMTGPCPFTYANFVTSLCSTPNPPPACVADRVLFDWFDTRTILSALNMVGAMYAYGFTLSQTDRCGLSTVHLPANTGLTSYRAITTAEMGTIATVLYFPNPDTTGMTGRPTSNKDVWFSDDILDTLFDTTLSTTITARWWHLVRPNNAIPPHKFVHDANGALFGQPVCPALLNLATCRPPVNDGCKMGRSVNGQWDSMTWRLDPPPSPYTEAISTSVNNVQLVLSSDGPPSRRMQSVSAQGMTHSQLVYTVSDVPAISGLNSWAASSVAVTFLCPTMITLGGVDGSINTGAAGESAMFTVTVAPGSEGVVAIAPSPPDAQFIFHGAAHDFLPNNNVGTIAMVVVPLATDGPLNIQMRGTDGAALCPDIFTITIPQHVYDPYEHDVIDLVHHTLVEDNCILGVCDWTLGLGFGGFMGLLSGVVILLLILCCLPTIIPLLIELCGGAKSLLKAGKSVVNGVKYSAVAKTEHRP